MGKRAIISSDTIADTDAALVEIDNIISLLSTKIVDYLGDFTKSTMGKKSTGDVSLEFMKLAYKGCVDNPEILAASFKKEDFAAKLAALVAFTMLENKIREAINTKWATNLMICKTDALNYANEFYGIVQREAGKEVKYQPLYDSLKVYYKKSKQQEATTPPTEKPTTT
jgi:hypothetical protein